MAAVAFVGLLVVQYPAVASWLSQYNQSQLIAHMADDVQMMPATEITRALDAARRYNDALSGGAIVAPGERVAQGIEVAEDEHAEYQTQLNADGSGVMGRLRIARIDVDLPIYHGTSDETLSRGVGHLEGTSLPVGGLGQHSVLTAHRGLAQATLFDNLDQVQVGDMFTIEIFGEVVTYRVTDTRVVLPEDTEALYPVDGKDLVTLVTCTPLGINTHRILVTGERVLPVPAADLARAGLSPDIPGFPWWLVIIAAGFICCCALACVRAQSDNSSVQQSAK